MAKKKKKTKVQDKPQVSKKKKATPVVFPPVHQNIIQPKVFWITFGLIALMTFGLAWNVGVNGDDKYQVDYSEKLVDYYATMGQDTAALFIEKGNLHFYGGFFEVLCGGTNSVLGLEENDLGYHRVRHLYIAGFGLLAMLFAALIVGWLSGWHGALITLVILFLSPRFLGHSLMNPKDIPFACGYIMSIYYSLKWLAEAPKPSRNTLIGLIAGIALAVSTRVGGLLVVAYLGLFAGIHFLSNVVFNKDEKAKGMAFLQYLKFGSIPVVLGLLIAFVFWPFAMADPIDHISESLAAFSNFGVEIKLLFEGENIMSGAQPWYYPFKWMLLTFPLHILLGLVATIGLYPILAKKYKHIGFHMIAFAVAFPLLYLLYKDSILYDGWRHLLFTSLPMVVLAGIAWTYAFEWGNAKSKNMGFAVLGVLGLLCVEPLIFTAKNQHLCYTYFNPLAGGMNGSFGEFEQDYWGVSVKDAVDWLEAEGRLENEGTEPIVIASNFSYNANKYLRKRFEGKVRVDYVRFHQRFDKEWDYGIFVNRFIGGGHLRSGKWPTKRNIHSVEVNGIPVCAVLEKGQMHAFEARTAEKRSDFATAASAYEQEVAEYPGNELAWVGLANSALNSGNVGRSETAVNQALAIDSKNTNAKYYDALIKLNTGDKVGATAGFKGVLEIDKRYYLADYFLGMIAKDEGRHQEAFDHFRNTLAYNPKFRQGYLMIAEIYDELGQSESAAQVREQAAAIQ